MADPGLMRRIAMASVIVIAGCGRVELTRLPGPPEPSYIYVVMYDSDVPHLDFEGDSAVKEQWVSHDRPGASDFGFHLITMTLPAGQGFVVGGLNDDPVHHTVEFSGKMVRSGEDGFRLDGVLSTKTPVVIQYVEMTPAGAAAAPDYPEVRYDPGEHVVRFEGTVTGWYQQTASP